jgi:two-component system, NtrC family, sensor histidine kinase KinB
MKESVERMDSAALFLVAGERERGVAQAAASQRGFEEELRVQEGNITEAGEAEATRILRESWTSYGRAFEQIAAETDPDARRAA